MVFHVNDAKKHNGMTVITFKVLLPLLNRKYYKD